MPDPVAATQAAASVLVGYSDEGEQRLLLRRTNRHGIVAGATGTGKTVTLTSLAHGLAAQGVTIFAPDVKGDLAAISKLTPTRFWDLSGERGDSIAVSIRDIGPALFSRLLDATEPQERAITMIFAVARRFGLPLDTLKEMRAVIHYMENNVRAVETEIGSPSPTTIQVVRGKILMLEESGAARFFGNTTFSLDDLVGGGVVNVLRAETLIHNPSLYATFLFWFLNELFTKLPEVGDLDQPKLVFFFDEAHLLFQNASPAFRQKVEQVVRLIRSKGVGVFFVTQSPADIPDPILAQLGNRVQHALRAYTPSEQKGLRAAAQSFRPNPAFDTAETIQNLGVGEALVSLLDDQGVPTVVQRTRIAMTEIPSNAREKVIRRAPYRPVEDRPNLVLAVDNTVEPSAKAVPEPEVITPVMSDSSTGAVVSIGTMRDMNFNFAPTATPTTQTVEQPLELTTPRWAQPVRRKRKPLRLWLFPIFTTVAFGSWFASAFVAM